MRTLGFILEYDGTNFSGWQLQPGERTVHLEVRKALSIILREEGPVVHCSGRTDAGVHALYQVAHIETENPIVTERLRGSLNGLLPHDVSALAVAELPAGFHARRSAHSKTYLYRILNRRPPPAVDRGRVWHVPKPIDVVAMADAAQHLLGHQDFASFEGPNSQAKGTVRNILAVDVRRVDAEIEFRVTGDGFLKHMVRNIAGTLVEIGLGKAKPAAMRPIIDAKDRRAAGQTAPPQALFLERVYYPEPYESLLATALERWR